MVVSLAYHGQAIPLVWWCFRPHSWPKPQVARIHTLLVWVPSALPKNASVLAQADRGLGTSPDLLQAIADMGWHYLVRVQGSVRLRMQEGREASFAACVPSLLRPIRPSLQEIRLAGLPGIGFLGSESEGTLAPLDQRSIGFLARIRPTDVGGSRLSRLQIRRVAMVKEPGLRPGMRQLPLVGDGSGLCLHVELGNLCRCDGNGETGTHARRTDSIQPLSFGMAIAPKSEPTAKSKTGLGISLSVATGTTRTPLPYLTKSVGL